MTGIWRAVLYAALELLGSTASLTVLADADQASFENFTASIDANEPLTFAVCERNPAEIDASPWRYYLLLPEGHAVGLWYFDENGVGWAAGAKTLQKEVFWEFMGGVWSIAYFSNKVAFLETLPVQHSVGWHLEQVKAIAKANPCPHFVPFE